MVRNVYNGITITLFNSEVQIMFVTVETFEGTSKYHGSKNGTVAKAGYVNSCISII